MQTASRSSLLVLNSPTPVWPTRRNGSMKEIAVMMKSMPCTIQKMDRTHGWQSTISSVDPPIASPRRIPRGSPQPGAGLQLQPSTTPHGRPLIPRQPPWLDRGAPLRRRPRDPQPRQLPPRRSLPMPQQPHGTIIAQTNCFATSATAHSLRTCSSPLMSYASTPSAPMQMVASISTAPTVTRSQYPTPVAYADNLATLSV